VRARDSFARFMTRSSRKIARGNLFDNPRSAF
jgi:hypothetical protein